MKKSLYVIMTTALFATMISAGYAALFSDVEIAADNNFTAGSLDLTINGLDDPAIAPFMVVNMKPGDTEKRAFTLKNVGTVCGQPQIEFGPVTNDDNLCTEPEGDVDATCGAGEGELGETAYAMLKWRQNGASWNTVRMTASGDPLVNNLAALGPVGLGKIGPNPDPALPVLCENDEVEVEFSVWINHSVGNQIQTDSILFDIIFGLLQD